MEKETLPGIFVSLMTKERMHRRVATLKGDDLVYFIEQCNPVDMAHDHMKDEIGVNRSELLQILSEMDPNFDPENDYYVIRHSAQV